MKKLRIRIRRIFVKFICVFVPFQKARRKIRNYFFQIGGQYVCGEVVSKIRALPDPVFAWRNFVKGLDDDSAVTATRSLAIVDTIYSKPSEILTPCEYSDFMENKIKLETGVFKINNNCYAFGKDLLPIKHFEYSVFCTKHGLDTIDLSKVPQGSVIIDVGAFIGDSALIFRKYFKNKIYSFEAMEINYEVLLKTIELNDMAEQVVPIKYALSDGKTKIYAGSKIKFQYSGFRTSSTPSGDVLQSCTLDDFIKKNNLKTGLIKVDVEGGEQSFLRGARETIVRDRPILLLSIYHSWSDLDYFKIKEIIESWNLGYTFRIFKPMDNNILEETLLICEQK